MLVKRIIVAILIFALILLSAYYIRHARYENSLVNPEVFPAFVRIENHALLYIDRKIVDREEYGRCKSVVDNMDSEMSAEEYYEFLLLYGFDLPPYKLSNPPTDEQKQQAMQYTNSLRDEQAKIIQMRIDNLLTEIQKQLNK
jgi:hypothetical protein